MSTLSEVVPLAVKLTPDPVAFSAPPPMVSGPFSVEFPKVAVNEPPLKTNVSALAVLMACT